MDNYRVYNNLFWIFLIQMNYRLQSMYKHMVGRAESVVSPFYFIPLAYPSYIEGHFKVQYLKMSVHQRHKKDYKLLKLC